LPRRHRRHGKISIQFRVFSDSVALILKNINEKTNPTRLTYSIFLIFCMTLIRIEDFPLKDETNVVIGIGIEIHKTLGFGFLEIVYKDALEYEFQLKQFEYSREKQYIVKYKNITLPHSFYADFVLFDSIILEIKAKDAIAEEDCARTINYLRCSGCKVGLILNFGRIKLGIKRLVF
jgi:GxxExxY protein